MTFFWKVNDKAKLVRLHDNRIYSAPPPVFLKNREEISSTLIIFFIFPYFWTRDAAAIETFADFLPIFGQNIYGC